MIQIEGVSQEFRAGFWMKKVQVLQNIHLTIPDRSVFGLLGANGAGKTTLMLLMIGMRTPTRGRVKIGGDAALSAQAKSRIGYLPERPYFHAHLTGRQFLKFVGELSGLPSKTLESRICQVLDRVGLKHAHSMELRRFSKGMLQRIGIAQAILHDPEILILDEPMSGLDPVGRKEIRELISELARDGRTVIFSSHVIPDVEALCTEFALLKKGRLTASGRVQEFLKQELLEQVIEFSGEQNVQQLESLGRLARIPEGWKLAVPPTTELGDVLQRLLSQHATIHSVQPMRRSLEDVLFEVTT